MFQLFPVETRTNINPHAENRRHACTRVGTHLQGTGRNEKLRGDEERKRQSDSEAEGRMHTEGEGGSGATGVHSDLVLRHKK